MLVSLQKQECWGYKVIKESRAGRYLKPFRHNTGSWQTDWRTDRRTDTFSVSKCRAYGLCIASLG